jgi:hypothetical protein
LRRTRSRSTPVRGCVCGRIYMARMGFLRLRSSARPTSPPNDKSPKHSKVSEVSVVRVKWSRLKNYYLKAFQVHDVFRLV